MNGVESAKAVEPSDNGNAGEQDWLQSLLSFGVQNYISRPRTNHMHRRYDIIRRKDGIKYIDKDITASIANRMRRQYRAEGYLVDLIEVGT